MKLNAALAKSLLMAASIGTVIPVLAQAPAKPGPATPKKDLAKAEETPPAEAAISGQTIPRKDGTFLGLTIEEGNFKLAFYDQKKKPVAPDAARAAARWNPQYKKGDERVILNLTGDGQALQSNKFVRPPYIFKLYITLLSAQDEAMENFVIDFRG